MSKTLKTAIPFIILVVFAGTSIAPLLSTNSLKTLTPDFSGTIALSNTQDQTQTGSAQRDYKDNIYTITLSGNLKDPTEGNHYEGWIVRLSPFKITSIGQMSKNTDGIWTVSYSEQNPQTDYETFTTILVTEEIGTQTPEIPNSIHTLEGTF